MRTFSLGAGADTVVFESTPSANGQDIITGFTSGSDKIAIGGTKGFLGATYASGSDFVGASDTINTNGSGDLSQKQVFVSTTKVTGGSSGIFKDSVSSGKFKITNNQKLFVVDTTDNNTLYFVVGDADVSSNGAAVTKVGTLNIGTALTAGDFIDVV